MKRFWSYVARGPYAVGCTGQAVETQDPSLAKWFAHDARTD